jgi:predicted dehydrogenase
MIRLPITNQKQYIRAALVAQKHVLSEKPVAENLKDADELIEWYRKDLKTKATWHVAENWRFLNSIAFAKEEAGKLGRTLGFRVRIYDNIQKGWKFFGEDQPQCPALSV